MPIDEKQLIQEASHARQHSYAPYSNLHIGAAIAVGDNIYKASNIENASFGATICAERAAMSILVSQGHRTINGIAIVSSLSPPIPPCGICLQMIQEFAVDPENFYVVLANDQNEIIRTTLATLIPHRFVCSDVIRSRKQ